MNYHLSSKNQPKNNVVQDVNPQLVNPGLKNYTVRNIGALRFECQACDRKMGLEPCCCLKDLSLHGKDANDGGIGARMVWRLIAMTNKKGPSRRKSLVGSY